MRDYLDEMAGMIPLFIVFAVLFVILSVCSN